MDRQIESSWFLPQDLTSVTQSSESKADYQEKAMQTGVSWWQSQLNY